MRLALLAVLLAAVVSAAQDQPDFSGEWVLESAPASADAPSALAVVQRRMTTNVRGEPVPPFFREITISRIGAATSRTETFLIGVVGGSTPDPKATDAPRMGFSVAWEGQSLVFERNTYTGPIASPVTSATTREAWSVDAGGRLRTTIMSRSGDAATTIVSLYRRK